ncbi:type II secretion system secretin GspD [Marinospirillum minutulum]|uniref:type II secretion system secretin GspD n=1 Tax=Marinospirillum minutulum TaxID=64974 RepID=UPI000684EC97|nr:type II secretion system secretin GspD [Marinospirillum minutulum]
MKLLRILSLLWLLMLVILPLQASEERFSVNLQDVELSEFIDSVGRITATTFLVDPRVRGKVSIRSQQKLTANEVYEVFLSQLRVNGFAAVALNDGTQKIVPEQTARLEAIPVEGNEQPNSDGKDLLATRVLSLQNSDAAQLVNILTPLMDRRIGVITHYAPTNLLILTDWGTNLERLASLVERIDQVSSDNLSLITLEHASASEMEQLLTQLLRREGRGGQPPQIMSDNRLNSLLVRADKATRKEIQRLVTELDQPVERSATTQVFYLRHAKAAEMATLLQAMAGEETSAKTENASSNRKTLIQAHESTNALVVAGNPDQIREMRLLVDQLDIRRAQVLVEAIIVEISDTQARDLGVQWLMVDQNSGSIPLVSSNFTGNQGLGSIAAGAVTGGTEGALGALAGLQGITAGVGRLSSSGISFGVLLNALQSNTNFNILSTPSILTLDNAEASILVGQEVPFVTGSTAGDNNANPFTTIQRKEVGVRLQITPQINDGNSVRLEILQEVSNIEDSVTASDIITNKREIRTTVMADNNDIIVLGGLIREDEKETVRKVPLLGDIPFLGALFRSTSVSREKRNLMVFIKPQILHDRDSLAQLSSEKYRYMRAAHLLESGDQDRLAPWDAAPTSQATSLSELFPSRREQRAAIKAGQSN